MSILAKRLVAELVKASANYGKAAYQYHESMQEVKRQKSNLENLHSEAKKPETKKVSGDARKLLREHISQTRKRLKAETAYSRVLSRRVTFLEHVIEIKPTDLWWRSENLDVLLQECYRSNTPTSSACWQLVNEWRIPQKVGRDRSVGFVYRLFCHCDKFRVLNQPDKEE